MLETCKFSILLHYNIKYKTIKNSFHNRKKVNTLNIKHRFAFLFSLMHPVGPFLQNLETTDKTFL